MKILFPALKSRFDGVAVLVATGKKFLRGFDGEPLKDAFPYTEVSGSLTDTLDTFKTDIEIYSVTFTYFSNSSRPGAADDWQELMIDNFDDANIASDDFSTAGCFRTNKQEPFLEDGLFRASIDYDITIQRAVKIPATRYA